MKLISLLIPMIKEKESIDFFVQKRIEDGPLNGLWEFPGGKVEPGESAFDAAMREFREEVGFDVAANDVKLFSQYQYSYEDRVLLFNIHVFDASLYIEQLSHLKREKIPFESAQDVVQRANIPAANKEFIIEMMEFFRYQQG